MKIFITYIVYGVTPHAETNICMQPTSLRYILPGWKRLSLFPCAKKLGNNLNVKKKHLRDSQVGEKLKLPIPFDSNHAWWANMLKILFREGSIIWEQIVTCCSYITVTVLSQLCWYIFIVIKNTSKNTLKRHVYFICTSFLHRVYKLENCLCLNTRLRLGITLQSPKLVCWKKNCVACDIDFDLQLNCYASVTLVTTILKLLFKREKSLSPIAFVKTSQ